MAIALKNISPRELTKIPFFYPSTLCIEGKPRIIVDIGPGGGDFLFHLAETNPDSLIVGIEIRGKRVDKLVNRIEGKKIRNVIIIQDDARAAIPRFFSDDTVDEIHINFPDPWPKRRHTKNRAMNAHFLGECARILKAGGTLNFATDHTAYAAAMAEGTSKIPELEMCMKADETFPTYFAMKWKAMGREIVCRRYKKLKRPGKTGETAEC